MEDEESARRRNREYYGYSPLEIFSDSYFTHPLHHDEQSTNFEPENLGIEDFGATNFASSTGSVAQQTDYHQPYQSQTPMDLDLLSAENYHEGVYPQSSSRARSSGSIELYGGLLATSPEVTEPTSPPTTMKTRRSKKEASSADESSTRQRGRPRLDTRDQTAAERRRTQIRLAQRAYRQRKETTISGLNERVVSLEKTIDDMNKTLLDFNDLAIASGIERANLSLARSLQSTVGRFAELARNSTHKSDIEEDDDDKPILSAEVEQPRVRNLQRRVAAASQPHPVSMLGYETTFEERADDDDGEIAQDFLTQAQSENLPILSDWTSTEAMQQYRIERPETPGIVEHDTRSMQQLRFEVEETANDTENFDATEQRLMRGKPFSFGEKFLCDFDALPLPNSYSYQETSFARRLLRSSVEASYRLMTDPNSRPEDKRRFCKFTWNFANSQEIIAHMGNALAKKANESLERWGAPQLHPGGAGLHYPRVGIDAGGQPPTWWADEAPMGPSQAGQPETPPVPNSMAISEIIRTLGMDGEWFDSNDVEQYLRSKGLLLDGQSQVVEITDTEDSVPELVEAQPPSGTSPGASSSQESSWGARSPPNPDLLWSSDPFLQSADYLWDEDTAVASEIPDVNMDFSYTAYADSKAFVPSLEFEVDPATMPNFNIKMKKFVDVEKFLSTIVQSNVCLGRTPGFRRAAVDSALALATVEQY